MHPNPSTAAATADGRLRLIARIRSVPKGVFRHFENRVSIVA